MLNSLLIFGEIILAFTGVILSFKFFKKEKWNIVEMEA